MKVPDKYSEVRKKIKAVFDGSASRYGYRRIHSSLKNEEITVSKKVIRRIMQEDKLVVPNIKRKKYNSYKGEITPTVPNVIERDFSAEQRFAISVLQNIIANAILYCDGFYALLRNHMDILCS